MKRKIIIVMAIIIYIVSAIVLVRTYLPSDEFVSKEVEKDNKGNFYLIKQSNYAMWLMQMNAQGEVLSMSSCPKMAKEVHSHCRYQNGVMYLQQIWYENGMQHFSVWKKDNESGRLKKVWQKSMQEDINITDFRVVDEEIYVSGIQQQTEDIYLFSYSDKEEETVCFETDFLPAEVHFGNNGIYALTQDNQLIYLRQDGTKEACLLEDVCFFRTGESGIYYQQIDSDVLTYSDYSQLVSYLYEDMPQIWDIRYMAEAKKGVAVVNYKDTVSILLFDDENRQYIEKLEVELAIKVRALVVPFVMFTFAYIIVVIAVYLVIHTILSKKKLLYQTLSVLAMVSAVWVAIIFGILSMHEDKSETENRMFYASTCCNIQKDRLEDNIQVNQLNYDSYRGSEQQKIVEEILANNAVKNTWYSLFARTELLCDQEETAFIFSEEMPYGRNAATVYDAKTMDTIKACFSTGEEQNFIDTVGGVRYAFVVSLVGQKEQKICILTRLPVSGVGHMRSDIYPLLACAILGWLIIIVFLSAFLHQKWKPINRVVSWMDKVSRGDYRIENSRIPDNEYGLIWTSMERMCKNLQLQNYKNTDMLNYIYQFTPKNFETLFGKEHLQEIEIGETIQLLATVGIISIIDKDTLLKGKVQKQYIQYANQLMEILFKQNGSEQAVFLQNGGNMESVKAVFQGESISAEEAMRYSIDCMELLLGQPESRYESKPFILLHTSRFVCGLAGGSKQAYPFITSMELEILNTYIDEFKKHNVKMVVTKQTLTWMEDTRNTRYLGYISSKDEQYSFQLYEILDVCPQAQKNAKQSTSGKFQQALDLYYKNNFYLARSTFSEVLKECPEDGISRWYLFASEELFNREDNSNARHDLFWQY